MKLQTQTQTLALATVFLFLMASAAALGEYKPIQNTNALHVIEIAKFAVSEYNKQSDSKLKFNKVIKGEYQIVSGINYRLTLSTGEGPLLTTYETVVWEDLHDTSRKLIYFKPVPVPGPEPVLGGYNPIPNPNAVHVIEIAKFAVSEYNKQSGSKFKLHKVIKGETQVVNGVNYRLTLSTGKGSLLMIYETVVLEQSWLDSRKLIYFKPINRHA